LFQGFTGTSTGDDDAQCSRNCGGVVYEVRTHFAKYLPIKQANR
jgi:hypothetical protein